MGTCGRFRRTRQGFTLVELLTVIVIIGILASLITGAAIVARAAVKRTVVLTEIAQLDIALQRYKNECGEYPPDFTGLNQDNDHATHVAGEAAAELVLNRHLKKRFPKFRGFPDSAGVVQPGWDGVVLAIFAGYGVDASRLDSASALAFWLGGLPESATSTKPAGFHEDRSNPFKPGLPRTQPFFEFGDDNERYKFKDGAVLQCRYFPKGIKDKPYVYFRPQRDRGREPTYWFVAKDPTTAGQDLAIVRTWPPVLLTATPGAPVDQAVPYPQQVDVLLAGPPPVTDITWRAEDTYQIVSAGMDGLFGTRLTPVPVAILPVASPQTPLPFYIYPQTKSGDDFDDGDYDNLTSVFRGKLEDGIE